MKSIKKRALLIVVVLILINILYQLFLKPYVTIGFLKHQRDFLFAQISKHYVKSVFLFVLLYSACVGLSIPIATLLSTAGGYLFNVFPGVLYVICAATIGSIFAFLAFRYFLRDHTNFTDNGSVITLKKKFAGHEIRTLLVLRLLPIFPFFLVNFVAALSDISLVPFIVTTALGILPASLIYTFFGSRLDTIKSTRDIFSFYTIMAILLVIIIFAGPLFFKWLTAEKKLKQ